MYNVSIYCGSQQLFFSFFWKNDTLQYKKNNINLERIRKNIVFFSAALKTNIHKILDRTLSSLILSKIVV